jgi:hypothetical protein
MGYGEDIRDKPLRDVFEMLCPGQPGSPSNDEVAKAVMLRSATEVTKAMAKAGEDIKESAVFLGQQIELVGDKTLTLGQSIELAGDRVSAAGVQANKLSSRLLTLTWMLVVLTVLMVIVAGIQLYVMARAA